MTTTTARVVDLVDAAFPLTTAARASLTALETRLPDRCLAWCINTLAEVRACHTSDLSDDVVSLAHRLAALPSVADLLATWVSERRARCGLEPVAEDVLRHAIATAATSLESADGFANFATRFAQPHPVLLPSPPPLGDTILPSVLRLA
jgi:hypothetical protein